MSRHRRIAGALSALTVLTCTASAGQADAAIHVEQAKFKITVKGVQTVKWDYNHHETGECDADQSGHGTEVVRFESAPTVATVMKVDNYAPQFVIAGKFHSFYAKARISRHGSYTTGKTHTDPSRCADGDPKTATPQAKPDCGTKTSAIFLNLAYDLNKKDKLTLQNDQVTPLGPFKTCPSVGGWPSLLEYQGNTTSYIGNRLPSSEVFDAGNGQLGVRGAGRKTYDSGEGRSTTTIEWNVLMTRIKTK